MEKSFTLDTLLANRKPAPPTRQEKVRIQAFEPFKQVEAVPIPTPERKLCYDLELLSGVCIVCGAGVEYYSHATVAYCGKHWPYGEGNLEVIPEGGICCICGEQARHASPLGSLYCDQHIFCHRGHPIRWRWHERDRLWLCACYWEQGIPVEPAEEASSLIW